MGGGVLGDSCESSRMKGYVMKVHLLMPSSSSGWVGAGRRQKGERARWEVFSGKTVKKTENTLGISIENGFSRCGRPKKNKRKTLR